MGYELRVSEWARKQHSIFIERWTELERHFLDRHGIDRPGLNYSRKKPGYHSLDPGYVIDQLNYLLNNGEIKSGANFLDLGSGLGANVAAAARMGLNSFGIELDRLLAAGSREIITKLEREDLIPKIRL